MSTVIRSELSKKNKYWVEKHRYYELKHFCLQYPFWKKLYSELDGFHSKCTDEVYSRLNIPGNPTANIAEKRLYYLEKMEIVEQTAIEADAELASYILKAVTEGLSYPRLKINMGIPCSRDVYYECYRRFFWLLHSRKNYI